MEDLSLHILDIAENSIGARAGLVQITIARETARDVLTIEIEDDGRGMPEEIRAKVLDPFYTTRTTRKVGMGLPLFAQSARETGGDVSVMAGKSGGTIVTALFRQGHIDMKPLGDIAETLVVLIAGNPKVDFLFTYRKNDKTFTLDTRRIKEELESMPISASPVLTFLKDYLNESIREVNEQVV